MFQQLPNFLGFYYINKQKWFQSSKALTKFSIMTKKKIQFNFSVKLL